MSEERFVDIETRLAHQDQMLNELNEALVGQQDKIMQLEELCRSLTARIKSMGDAMPDREAGAERPPHY